ncbi:rRNA methyltransferase [Dorcoceras hygrometricum]|uniref:rRNA methyltransferase n=1 Tax=Dorcoceras hygrometricum TaxID=472368 RepID=A0A2Z7C7W0_9LAMI|nr:rRNA methyltransferase [Dorcoceras hygrometricum]
MQLLFEMLAGFTSEEAEADTVADQGLKRVNHIFGGLNEGIWPKTEELTKIYEVCWKKCRRKKMNSRCLESVAQDLVSAMMTSAYLLEKATSSNVDMLAGFTTEEAEADTVADQGLKRVNRIFGGLNEGIWPKTEELTASFARWTVSEGIAQASCENVIWHRFYEVCWKKCRRKKMNSRCLESVAQDLVSAMMTSAYLLEEAGISNADLESATLTSAYLLDEAGISNADVSISVEKRRGIRSLLKLLSTDTVRRVTVDKAVGRYYYRSCWQTSPFKREGICD